MTDEAFEMLSSVGDLVDEEADEGFRERIREIARRLGTSEWGARYFLGFEVLKSGAGGQSPEVEAERE